MAIYRIFEVRASFLVIPLVAVLALGCGKAGQNPEEKSIKEGAGGRSHSHEHKAPHGGTVVILGDEEGHLEMVLDAKAGALTAYVLDGHMESFVRLPVESFVVKARFGGSEHALRFEAVGSRATGEKPGDTSMFVAKADWLKTQDAFDAELENLEVRGRIYRGVRFSFPSGGRAMSR